MATGRKTATVGVVGLRTDGEDMHGIVECSYLLTRASNIQ